MARHKKEVVDETLPDVEVGDETLSDAAEESESVAEAPHSSVDLASIIRVIAGAADVSVKTEAVTAEARVMRKIPNTPSAQAHREAVIALVEWFESKV